MTSRTCVGVVALLAAGLAACRETDRMVGPTGNARVEVTSDPPGAQIFVDSINTGKVTPDLLRDLSTDKTHEILVRLTKDGVIYGYRVPQLQVKPDSLVKVIGPLTMKCTSTDCGITLSRYNTLGSLRISTQPNGALFSYDGTNKGMYYPTGTSNGYIAAGTPLITGIANAHDTMSLGIYDTPYLAGRPAPEVTQTADRYSLKQSFWVLPPSSLIVTNAPTIRGIEVTEELIGVTATNDVAFIKVNYRNITATELYRAIDPLIPATGITYNWVYLGFAIDPDIGGNPSGEKDDLVTYDPGLDMVYAYDSDFFESGYSTGFTDKPALVGLRLLEAPAGASVKVLNAWPSEFDWGGGDASERAGWGILSGQHSVSPDMPGQQIGHIPTTGSDYRMLVSAGPITLAPGQSASITVAVIIAPPTPGTFTSGTFVDPGNPTVPDRTIAKIAAQLIDKASKLTVPQ